MPRSELVQSLLRGLEILQLVASKPEGMRLNELVEATSLKKPTVHNLLRTLAAREFVVKDSLNRFSAGPAAAELAQQADKNAIEGKLSSRLLALAELFPGHVITVSTLQGSKIKCLMRVSSDLPGMVQKPAEQYFMPFVSVTAIALQAANPELESELEKSFPFEEFGIGKWGSEKRFAQLKTQVLKDGFCCHFTSDRSAVAFIMPDRLALGFSTRQKSVNMLEKYKAAAAEFRSSVWGK